MRGSIQRGFTLIELMIAVAIVGILTSVAVSTYQSSVRKSARSDAKVALSQLAQRQERYYSQNMAYATSLEDLTGSSDGVMTEHDYYEITLAEGSSATGFTLVATAVSGGRQASDLACKTFSITHTGAQTATDSDGNDTDSCW